MTLVPVRGVAELQCDAAGNLRHLLDTEGLSRQMLERIFSLADSFAESGRRVKSVPLLRGKTVVLLFFEDSTRTRTTFELAAKRLSADVLTISAQTSSTSKGESLLDTVATLEAMHADLFVIRHGDSGAAELAARHVGPGVGILNAGDGWHAHPTQALLDAYTLGRVKGQLAGLRVAIVGDFLHSRVARSEIHALRTLGVSDLRLVGPGTLVPDAAAEAFGVRVMHDLRQGIEGADVVMALRLQRERMAGGDLPADGEYFQHWGLDEERMRWAAPGALVMHPGPINRGVEIDGDLADGPRSLILQQVSNGIAVRMAVMALMVRGAPA